MLPPIFYQKRFRLENMEQLEQASFGATDRSYDYPHVAENRAHPDDFYLLRVGYAGTMGALTDIDSEGFFSAAFHVFSRHALRMQIIQGVACKQLTI